MGRVAREPITAQHEAAHVVVGLSVGLRLRSAGIRPDGSGWTLFRGQRDGGRRRIAWGLMFAAGIAISKLRGRPAWHGRGDRRRLRELGFSSDDIRLLTATACRFLETDAAIALLVHFTGVLLERDIRSGDPVLTTAYAARILAETHGA